MDSSKREKFVQKFHVYVEVSREVSQVEWATITIELIKELNTSLPRQIKVIIEVNNLVYSVSGIKNKRKKFSIFIVNILLTCRKWSMNYTRPSFFFFFLWINEYFAHIS